MGVKPISSAQEFKDALAKSPAVFVDFFAEWCGPCKAIAPKLEQLSEQYSGIAFFKVDVDQCEELAREYKITAMPTFMAFVKGEKIETIVGADPNKIGQILEKMNSQAAAVPA